MLLLLAFQRAIARVCIGNKNEWLQTTKISYDGPAKTPLWRHSPASPLVSSGPKYFFKSKNGMPLLLAFQRAVACVCATNRSCYIKKTLFCGKCTFPMSPPNGGWQWRHFPSQNIFRHRKPDGNHVANCQAFQHNIACFIARIFLAIEATFDIFSLKQGS